MGRSRGRPGRASRVLRGRDLRGRRGALGGPGAGHAGGRELAGGESVVVGSGGVGGDGQLLGGRADPRAARRTGWWSCSPDDTGISSARAKTDKLDARAMASLLWRGELEAVWMPDERCRILRRRLARREQLVRSRTRSKNEIHAVSAAPAAGQAAVLGSVRGQGPPVAGGSGAAAGGARVGRRRDAPRRVPRRGDRRGGEADRPAGAVLAGDPPADDRPGREPDLCRVVHRRRRQPQPVPDEPQARRLSRAGPAGQAVRRGTGAQRPDL